MLYMEDNRGGRISVISSLCIGGRVSACINTSEHPGYTDATEFLKSTMQTCRLPDSTLYALGTP